jgi:hypothetical protein
MVSNKRDQPRERLARKGSPEFLPGEADMKIAKLIEIAGMLAATAVLGGADVGWAIACAP